MRASLILAAVIGAAAVAPLSAPAAQARAAACRAHTPRPGSAERRQILDALRPHVEEFTGVPTEFVVAKLDVACGYARALVDPREKGGEGAHYESLDALMIKRDGKWRFGMLASGEPDSDPAADQFKARWPDIPEALLYL